jgi:hypothetical protein
MTKAEILNEICDTRVASRLALKKKEYIESSAHDRATDRLIKNSQDMGIGWDEIKFELEFAEWLAKDYVK